MAARSDYDRDCPRCGASTTVDDNERHCDECDWEVHKSSSSFTGPTMTERVDELERRIDRLESRLAGGGVDGE